MLANKIPAPKNLDSYLKLFHDKKQNGTKAILQMLPAGWKAYLADKGAEAGYKLEINSVQEKDGTQLGMFMRNADDYDKYCAQLGNWAGASSAQVRTTGEGLLLSIPITTHNNQDYSFNRNLSPQGIGRQLPLKRKDAASYDGLVAHADPESHDAYLRFLKSVLGSSGFSAFTDPSATIDVKVKIDPTAKTVGLDPGSKYFDPDMVRTLKSWVRDYRIVGAPLKSSARYNGELKAGVTNPTSVKDVVDPGHYVLWLSQNRDISVMCDILMPKDIARYVTQHEDVSPPNALMWLFYWMRSQVGGEGSAVKAVSSLTTIAESVGPQLRGKSKSDLYISRDGFIYYLPLVDKCKDYEDQLHASFDVGDGVLSFNSSYSAKANEPEANKKKLPANTVIFTDFKNHKLAYTDERGLPKVEDLDGWQAANSTHVSTLLELPITHAANRARIKAMILSDLGMLFRKFPTSVSLGVNEDEVKAAVALGLSGARFRQIVGKEGVGEFISWLSLTLRPLGEWPNQWDDVHKIVFETYGKDLERFGLAALVQDTATPVPTRWVREAFVQLNNHITGKEQDYLKDRTVVNGLRELGLLKAIALYGTRYPEVKAKDLKRRDAYLNLKDPGWGHQPKALPYISTVTPGMTAEEKERAARIALPHQCRVSGILEINQPKNVILDVDAGGGKSISILRYVVDLLHSGKVKRPCIAMPSILFKNYIEENIYFFSGKLNMIPINRRSINLYGEEKLRETVLNAPPNTILLVDFNFLGNPHAYEDAFYGPTVVKSHTNTEFLKTLGIDSLTVDESHQLRNASSHKAANTRRLALSDGVKYRTLATGTFINNKLSDTAGQFAMIDPSVFGNKQDFNDEFGAAYGGGDVTLWADNAEKNVRARIAQQCALITAKRKEWGPILPELKEVFHAIVSENRRETEDEVCYTEAWKAAYDSILHNELEKMMENPDIRKRIEGAKGKRVKNKDLDDDDDDEAENDDGLDLGGLLNPYLQRLERFMTASSTDEMVKELLEKDKTGLKKSDFVGPKVVKTIQIIRNHMREKIKGKILIFTNYHDSADALFDALPADIKSRFIRLRNSSAEKDLAKFNNDPNILGLIGIEDKLGTGLNLQAASRLIRLEGRWNPGDLEQANSRVWRPDLKSLGGDQRGYVYLDWVVTDKTIDVTKFARLTSKILSKVRFDEAHNPKYKDLKALPIVKMNLDNLRELNSIDEHLMGYVQEYMTYKDIYNRDLKEFLEENKDTYKKKIVTTTGTGVGDDDKILVNVPYIREMRLPMQKELNMVPYSAYVDDNAGADKDVETFDTKGLWAHTEFGDGQIVGTAGRTLRIKMLDGQTVSGINKLVTFILLDGKPKQPIKKQLATLLELPHQGNLVQEPSAKAGKGKKGSVPIVEVKSVKKGGVVKDEPKAAKKDSAEEQPTAKPVKKSKAEAHPYVEVAYDQITVGVSKEEIDPDVEKFLVENGFRDIGPYVYASIPNKMKLAQFIDKLEEQFEVESAYRKRLESLKAFFNKGPKNLFNARGALQNAVVRNFWRLNFKAIPKGHVRPYALIVNHELHIAFGINPNQASNKLVMRKVRVPNVKWYESDGEFMKFVRSKAEARAAVAHLGQAFTIPHAKEVAEDITALRTHGLSKEEQKD